MLTNRSSFQKFAALLIVLFVKTSAFAQSAESTAGALSMQEYEERMSFYKTNKENAKDKGYAWEAKLWNLRMDSLKYVFESGQSTSAGPINPSAYTPQNPKDYGALMAEFKCRKEDAKDFGLMDEAARWKMKMDSLMNIVNQKYGEDPESMKEMDKTYNYWFDRRNSK